MTRLPQCFLLGVCFTFGASCQTVPPAASAATHIPTGFVGEANAPPPPSLIVLITIDQMRGDYLDRFGPQLKGGLARLARGGAWFTNAHHDHAITETAPGHATLLSGRFPRATGIMANRYGVEDSAAPLLVSGPALGASPRRFQGTELYDWLLAKDPSSRALSVSLKDRGAILPIGRSRADVYWYYPNGDFTTSRYYRDTLPDWVKRFNARRMAPGFAGISWTPLLADSAYKERDSVAVEHGGTDFLFPHRFPADSAGAASYVRTTPWMDELTLALALDGVNALSLGGARRMDLLAISLSATDYIGHSYGPDSKEIHDNILRLDRNLGAFFDSLFRVRDSSRIAIVLSGDHGAGTMPELAPKSMSPPPVRLNAAELAANLRRILSTFAIDTTLVELDQQIVLADRSVAINQRAALDSALSIFAQQTRRLPGIARVDRFQDLLRGDTINDAIARRWTHQFPAATNVEMVITQTPLTIFGTIVATHGSPYDYDSNVPIIFYGGWFVPGRYHQFVRTVDVAPTLAAVAGVTPSQRLDGVVLARAVRK
ncbi:MAG: alkaline phosphatase family protein [Gemmatimonadaceae bacterium]